MELPKAISVGSQFNCLASSENRLSEGPNGHAFDISICFDCSVTSVVLPKFLSNLNYSEHVAQHQQQRFALKS